MRDPLDGDWDAEAYWSTEQVGEAVPGVLTPLTWSLWRRGGEAGLRAALVATGALERRRAGVPRRERDRVLGVFHGRLAVNADRTARRSGIALAQPRAAASSPRDVRALAEGTASWWAGHVARAPGLDRDAARALWGLAADRFAHAMTTHLVCVFAAVRPVQDGLARLCDAADRPELAPRLTAGLGGHLELDVVSGLWDLAHGRASETEFLAAHGFAGPGELAARVWREEPTAATELAAAYGAASAGPADLLRLRAMEREIAERQLREALPTWQQAPARALLLTAERVLPLRGLGKAGYLRVLDVARAAARRNGELLAAAGFLDDPEDVFLLTAEEMCADVPRQGLVADRRARRAEHLAVALPPRWRGRPVPVPVTSSPVSTGTVLRGLGVSSGLAEGRARVVTDARDAAVGPGEILVAPDPDPSWAPVLFPAAGLVVDNGGTHSHAAVLARELSLPCVMGTGDGTRRLRTGDLLRVDGHSGRVEVVGVAP
ncbi:hypothetical protein GCM10009547_38570 [Sporichthya brevicatena]|uniref:PEP-utilising enzyme mobile domain-containing protein n=1 Tax=Sporichthya brevicatena TaxID=171442 RepID=A0ABN1H707_9ACTN